MLTLAGQRLSLEQVEEVARGGKVELSHDANGRMLASRRVIEDIIARGETVYGVNTGFGKLSDVHIPPADLRKLQLNLVRSHCCGLGEPLTIEQTRAMMLLRANVLAIGASGARPNVAQTIVEMLNKEVHPVIPSRGSVGASGDLAPLAHLALGMIGEGEAMLDGSRMNSGDALDWAEIPRLELEAKEGLALLNGTQAMSAVGGLALARALRLAELADEAGAMSLEGLLGTPVAFDERIHDLRPHPHQQAAAKHLRELLKGSEIRESHAEGDPRVQDAYCLRCMPQVHGAVRMALAHAREVVESESGSATDNPLVCPGGDVLSGGNFHGAPLALVFDYAAIALVDLVAISERRVERMINPDVNEHLPPFLTSHPGTGSGFMIAHVAMVALLNEMKVLAHPASTDNLPTSGGKEDHVSMGMTGALKLQRIVENAELGLAIELIVAAEALEYRRPLKSGRGVEAMYDQVRRLVPRLSEDRVLSGDIQLLAQSLATSS